jgi:hypothetical protein
MQRVMQYSAPGRQDTNEIRFLKKETKLQRSWLENAADTDIQMNCRPHCYSYS